MIGDGDGLAGLPRAPRLRDATPYVGGTNKLAAWSFICVFWFPPLAIVLGHVARRQIKRYGEDGGGLAMAGLILGYLATAFWVVLMVIVRSR